jgi:O-antigen/teichoic acid export membrane protein
MYKNGSGSDLKSQGFRALLWDLSGKFGTHSVGLIFTIFLARLLEPSDFGLLAMVMVYVGIAGVFSDIGLASALVQREKLEQIHYSSVFYFNLATGVFLAAITYFSAGWIAAFYGNITLIPITEVMSLSFILSALGSVQAVKLRKELNYGALTRSALAASVISGVVGVVLALNGYGVYSLVAQVLIMSAVRSILLWGMSNWTPSFQFSLVAMKELWGFGARMFFASLLNAVSARLDILVIGKLFPAATLGYFDLAKRLSNLVNQYASDSLISVMFPVLSKLQHERDQFNAVVLQVLKMLSLIVFLVIGVLFLTSSEVITLLYSEKWQPTAEYLKLLMLGGFAFPLNALLVNVLSSKGNSKGFLRMAIVKKAIFFSNFLVFMKWGVEAFLVGLILVGIVNTAITLLFASREMRVSYFLLAKPIVSQGLIFTISLVFVVWMVSFMGLSFVTTLFAKIIFFVLLFLGMNIALRTESWQVTGLKLLAAISR